MAKKSYPSNLVVLLKIDGACLNHKIFRRFLIELEVIVSTKPITSRSLLVVHSSVALYHCSCIVLIAMESRLVDIDFLFIVFVVSFSCRCHVDLS